MEGYDVITSDESKVGHVVGESNGCAIVENGLIRHTRHVVPLEFLHLDESAENYRTSLSKEMIHEAPEADGDGNFDAVEVSTYYGVGQEPDTPDSTSKFHAAGDETPFVDTRPDPNELAGGFESERMVRGGL
jgi:hypothetical protein